MAVHGAQLRAPAPIRSPAGHARTYDETERRLERLLDLIPITRVYDATPLDRLGVPVFSAVTPLAADLAVHAGKGSSPQAARISAIMEAVERVSAETIEPARVRRAAFCELEGSVLHPGLFDLPFTTAFAPDRRCSWVLGHDLLGGTDRWVALDLVISPAREGVCQGPETNGLAAGNTLAEAVLHALLEVVERDADARERFLSRYGEGSEIPPLRLLPAEGLPAGVAAWVAQLSQAGLRVTIQELTHDLDVPVFGVILTDLDFPGREGHPISFRGLGCDLDPEHALARAVCEAAQSHTAVLLGARDSFDGEPRSAGRGRFLERLRRPCVLSRFQARERPPDDIGERLAMVLARLERAGLHHCVVVELTRPDLGVPVVRVLVPGAAGPVGQSARRPALRLLRGLR